MCKKKSLTGLAKNSQDRCERTDVNPRMQTPLKNLVMVINEDLHNTRIHSKHTYNACAEKLIFLLSVPYLLDTVKRYDALMLLLTADR